VLIGTLAPSLYAVYATTTNGNLTLMANGTGWISTNSHVIPQVDNSKWLGSSFARWHTLHLSHSISDGVNYIHKDQLMSLRTLDSGATVGQVATFDGTKWYAATPSGGGGGVDPSYVDSAAISFFETTVRNTWYDVASLTINPAGTEKWEIVYEGNMFTFSTDSNHIIAYFEIVDSTDTRIDNAAGVFRNRPYSGSSLQGTTVRLTARVTINSSTTYKFRARNENEAGSDAAKTRIYNTGNTTARFYAKRVY
jgi:hypothetical protein